MHSFAGFAQPTSNTTYTPNQFFDVCLPHSSRGAVRLVGHVLRKTLGWCDEHGRPQAERHAISYGELERAGISREMVRSALNEALAGHFLRCVRQPQPNRAGHAAVLGLYELKWDERGEYIKDRKEFRGFFAGDGNRTYIPNQFFDDVLVQETLAVTKVVGAVIRLSIGFANKWGHRRRQVALSFQHIQNYSRIGDRKTLSQAVRQALDRNYVQRVEEGYFDPDGGRLSKAAVYALKWAEPRRDTATTLENGQKTPPAKTEPEERSENPTGNGQKTPPAERSENPTGIEIKQINKTLKQKDPAFAASFEALKSEGFDRRAAWVIASKYAPHCIFAQIDWLPLRKVTSNRLGMLRTAIEQEWPKPTGAARRETTAASEAGLSRLNSAVEGEGFARSLEHARRRLSQKLTPPTP